MRKKADTYYDTFTKDFFAKYIIPAERNFRLVIAEPDSKSTGDSKIVKSMENPETDGAMQSSWPLVSSVGMIQAFTGLDKATISKVGREDDYTCKRNLPVTSWPFIANVCMKQSIQGWIYGSDPERANQLVEAPRGLSLALKNFQSLSEVTQQDFFQQMQDHKAAVAYSVNQLMNARIDEFLSEHMNTNIDALANTSLPWNFVASTRDILRKGPVKQVATFVTLIDNLGMHLDYTLIQDYSYVGIQSTQEDGSIRQWDDSELKFAQAFLQMPFESQDALAAKLYLAALEN